MKNEVKRKMRFKSREVVVPKSRERNTRTKVNENFHAKVSRADFLRRSFGQNQFVMRDETGKARFTSRVARIRSLFTLTDHFCCLCIYNEIAKCSRELDSWPLLTMLLSFLPAALR